MSQSKYRKLDLVIAGLQRRFGSRAIYCYERPATSILLPHIATGFGELDQALGIGGIPRGQITEILGPATSGKATLAAKVIAQAQGAGHRAAWVDLSWTLDADYLHRCQVDLEGLLVVRPHNGEEAMAIASSLVAGELGVLIFDEVTSLKGRNLAPDLLQAALTRIYQTAIRSSCAVILLTTTYFGPPGDLANYPPGFSLSHCSAIRLALKQEEWIRKHGDVWGYYASVVVLKNRLARPAGPVRIKITSGDTVCGHGL